MKFLPPWFPLSPYPSATRPNGCRENINTPPTPSPQTLCVFKSNQLLFSGPWKSCGPRGLKRKGGGGWEERICTKLLLRPETARPCPPLTATGGWLGLGRYKWPSECQADLQGSLRGQSGKVEHRV